MIVSSTPLPCDILGDHLLAPMLSHRVDEETLAPELSSPQLFLNLRSFREHLARNHALYRPHNARRTIGRNRLDQKVRMVPVQPHFQKNDLPPLLDLNARRLQHFVHPLTHHHPAIFRGTDQVIHQHRYIVTLVDVTTFHPSSSHQSKPKQASGYRTQCE